MKVVKGSSVKGLVKKQRYKRSNLMDVISCPIWRRKGKREVSAYEAVQRGEERTERTRGTVGSNDSSSR